MKELEPGPHLDQMIRQTRNHHVQLSALADSKANMLMTTASLVMTLCVGYIMDPRLKWAATNLMGFSLATVFLAIYVAMPKINFSRMSNKQESIKPNPLDLLFFGNFMNYSLEEYESSMVDLMSDPDMVYKAQLHEIYSLGQFLAKKYRILRIANIIFLAGVFSSAALLLINLKF